MADFTLKPENDEKLVAAEMDKLAKSIQLELKPENDEAQWPEVEQRGYARGYEAGWDAAMRCVAEDAQKRADEAKAGVKSQDA